MILTGEGCLIVVKLASLDQSSVGRSYIKVETTVFMETAKDSGEMARNMHEERGKAQGLGTRLGKGTEDRNQKGPVENKMEVER